MTALLEIDHVGMRYGSGETAVDALVDVSLRVERGELVAVMGASGSGKSTLLTIAGGLTMPSSGRVVVDGHDLATLRPGQLATLRRRTLGFVFQDFNLVPALTALENVTLPLELDGIPQREAKQSALEALDSVQLHGLEHRYPDDLSGGQQQRVAIARAVVGGRSLVLADEPTGALDSHTGETVMRMLRARVEGGAGGVLVTHDARHAAWADRIVFIRDGRAVDEAAYTGAEAALTEVAP